MADIVEFRLEKGQTLFREGDDGNFFYILKSGTLELLIKNKKKKTFQEWDCFGELALLQKCKRTGTVRCLTDCRIYFIDGTVFREFQKFNTNKLKERIEFIELIPILKHLNGVQKTSLAEMINQVEFSDKEKIICEGDYGDNFYIIKEGLVSCRSKVKEIRRLYSKDYMGQNALFTEGIRTLDVVSVGRTICYEFTKEAFVNSLGENYKEIILFSIYFNHMSTCKFISEIFTEPQISDIYKLFKLKIYKGEDIVYSRDIQNNKKIIIVLEGNIINVKSFNLE
jgi:CRP-like cAMP-binding protein